MANSAEPAVVSAALIIIGNEILSGRTQDANMAYLGDGLNAIGIQLREARVIPDVAETIIDTVNELRDGHDYVFTTGGIGPTHDDITSECIAKAFGIGFGRNPEAEALLRSHYKPEDVTEARLRMANIPEGAELLDNPVSKAPGFRVENVYVLPGVPRIMQAMFEGFRHTLSGGASVLSRSITSFVQEGRMGEALGELQDQHADVEIGCYPFVRSGRTGAVVVVRHTDEAAVNAAADAVCQLVRDFGEEPLSDEQIPTDPNPFSGAPPT